MSWLSHIINILKIQSCFWTEQSELKVHLAEAFNHFTWSSSAPLSHWWIWWCLQLLWLHPQHFYSPLYYTYYPCWLKPAKITRDNWDNSNTLMKDSAIMVEKSVRGSWVGIVLSNIFQCILICLLVYTLDILYRSFKNTFNLCLAVRS